MWKGLQESFECTCFICRCLNTHLILVADVNECKIRKHNCSHHSYCQNTHGGFKCVCPKNYELSGTSCIPNDITRWTTPKYLLQDIMDGVWTRLVAAGAAGIIVLSLFVIVVLSCRKMCRKCAERKELKRLAYEGMKMVVNAEPLYGYFRRTASIEIAAIAINETTILRLKRRSHCRSDQI